LFLLKKHEYNSFVYCELVEVEAGCVGHITADTTVYEKEQNEKKKKHV